MNEFEPGDQEKLARAVQLHIPRQPWGHSGYEPHPLEVIFNVTRSQPWTVRFVLALNKLGSKRVWGFSTASTLGEALEDARLQQISTPRGGEVVER